MTTTRRTFLKALTGAGAALAAAPLLRAFAAPDPKTSDDFFIFIHAAGAWDVTVGLDPRNEHIGLVDPATTTLVDAARLKQWVNMDVPVDTGGYSFKLVTPSVPSPLVFGPAIGDLLKHASRLTVINGISMNTVSHQDGTTYAVTGRHLAGAKAVASSIDTMMADSLGVNQILPALSVGGYPSSYVGQNLDRRAVPLSVGGASTLSATLKRSDLYQSAAQRDKINVVLSQEAQDLAKISADPDIMYGMHLQIEGLRRVMKENLSTAFLDASLRAAWPKFQFANHAAIVNAAFAMELIKRNTVRCVSFSFGGFDTHFSNYRFQPQTQQFLFDTIAQLIDYLDTTPHPTKTGTMLSERTHILVTSDFCRTPMINVNQGRDHYPNNSFLVVSPKFKQNFVYGKSDPAELLPAAAGVFANGMRAVEPPDVLATMVSAFGIDPARYMRDGEVIKELLAA